VKSIGMSWLRRTGTWSGWWGSAAW